MDAELILPAFANLPIDWEITPAQAVALYLDWDDDQLSGRPPLRSAEDYSIYFLLDAWGKAPLLRLVRRSQAEAADLLVLPLPEQLRQEWEREFGDARGIFEITPSIKAWLRSCLEKPVEEEAPAFMP
jgi:hypothetical protein